MPSCPVLPQPALPSSRADRFTITISNRHTLFFLFSKLNDTDWTSGFRNIINISITPLLWSFGQLQKNRKSFESLRFNRDISQTCFPSTACVIFPPFALVSAICSSRWCQYCEWERGNCGRESFHHYKRYRSEDGWCGRRNVWTLLWGAQHHVPGAQRPAHCRQQPYWRIAKSGELNHINQPNTFICLREGYCLFCWTLQASKCKIGGSGVMEEIFNSLKKTTF